MITDDWRPLVFCICFGNTLLILGIQVRTAARAVPRPDKLIELSGAAGIAESDDAHAPIRREWIHANRHQESWQTAQQCEPKRNQEAANAGIPTKCKSLGLGRTISQVEEVAGAENERRDDDPETDDDSPVDVVHGTEREMRRYFVSSSWRVTAK